MRTLLCLVLLCLFVGPASAEPIRLTRITHIYGVVPQPEDPTKLYLATERGFFLAGPDGNAEPVSAEPNPILAFTMRADGTLLATGGEKQGAIASRDRGKTWGPFAAAGSAQPGPFLVLDAA